MKTHLTVALAAMALVASGQYENGKKKKQKHPKKEPEEDP